MLVGQPEQASVHGCFPGMPDLSADLRSSMFCFNSLLKDPRWGDLGGTDLWEVCGSSHLATSQTLILLLL